MWDLTSPMEKGYAMAGLKRIKIYHKSGLTATRDLESQKEETATAKGNEHKEALALDNGPSSSKPVVIKIEHPAWLETKGVVDVIKSADGKLNSLLKDFKWLVVMLEVQKSNPNTTEQVCATLSLVSKVLLLMLQLVLLVCCCETAVLNSCNGFLLLRFGHGWQGQEVVGCP